MQTVGILGGLGPESTIDYYSQIIKRYRKLSDTLINPNINIISIDIFYMLSLVEKRDFSALATFLANKIKKLEVSGSDFCVIASNTPHIVFNEIQKMVNIEIISIIDCTCNYISSHHYKKALLTGTIFTMKENFFSNIAEKNGIEIIVPNKNDMESIHNVIFPELEEGIIIPEKKANYLSTIKKYYETDNIDCVILGCTELPLMISQEDCPIPLISTSEIHINKIVKRLLVDKK